MILIDAHQDLAYNILNFGRDYTRSAYETRRIERESGSNAALHNGDTLLGYPDYVAGCIGIVFATLFAAPLRRQRGSWDRMVYENTEQAFRVYQAQLDVYHRLADEQSGKFRLVLTRKDLEGVIAEWGQTADPDDTVPEIPVGLVILMEGAEGIGDPGEVEAWYERGVRIIGPAWTGTRFCGGTDEPGPLTSQGFALLEAMGSYGLALDLSHMDEKAVLQALDFYPGTILATHANAAALLKGAETNRHLRDHVIAGIVERGGVIGVVPYNAFLMPGWQAPDGRDSVNLERVAAQIDHICQIAGDADHVGLGSDFDGGFGWQSVPGEIDTVADLQKLVPLLGDWGYTSDQIARIMGENWQRLLNSFLPETV